MKTFLKPRRLLIAGLLLVVIIALAIVYLNRPVESAETAIVNSDVAIARALADATVDSPMGHLIGLPDEIHGQTMTYEQAHLVVFKRPLASGDIRAKSTSAQVWLIVFHANIIEHVPAAPGKNGVPAKELALHQMAVILDAVTTDILDEVLVPNEKPLDVQSLPRLALPEEQVKGIPSQLPIKTEAPLPTLPPAQ